MLALLLFTAMTAIVLLAARGGVAAVALGDGSPANRELLADRRRMEDGRLVAAGFKPEESGHFWSRDGVWFAREAALQNAWREWHERKR